MRKEQEIIRTYSRGFYGTTGDVLEDLRIIMKEFYITNNWNTYMATYVVCDIFKEEFKDNMSEVMAKLAVSDKKDSISILIKEICKIDGDIHYKDKYSLKEE